MFLLDFFHSSPQVNDMDDITCVRWQRSCQGCWLHFGVVGGSFLLSLSPSVISDQNQENEGMKSNTAGNQKSRQTSPHTDGKVNDARETNQGGANNQYR